MSDDNEIISDALTDAGNELLSYVNKVKQKREKMAEDNLFSQEGEPMSDVVEESPTPTENEDMAKMAASIREELSNIMKVSKLIVTKMNELEERIVKLENKSS